MSNAAACKVICRSFFWRPGFKSRPTPTEICHVIIPLPSGSQPTHQVEMGIIHYSAYHRINNTIEDPLSQQYLDAMYGAGFT